MVAYIEVIKQNEISHARVMVIGVSSDLKIKLKSMKFSFPIEIVTFYAYYVPMRWKSTLNFWH